MRIGYLFSITLVIALGALTAYALADEIQLKEGGVLSGKILSESDKEVTIETKYGPQTIPRDRIAKIVKTAPEETYDGKRAKIASGDAEGHYQLGLWCKAKGETENATREFREAIRWNPEHAGGRKELGYLKYAGKWLTKEEAQPYLDRGLVEYEGRIVTAEEKEKLEAANPPAETDNGSSPGNPSQPGEKPKPTTGTAEKPEKKIEEKNVAWSEAKTKKTSHYTIKSNVDPRVLERYADLIDAMYTHYKSVIKGDLKEKGSLDVYIYASASDYEKYEEKPAENGGTFNFEKKRVIVCHNYKAGKDTTATALIRETVRQYLDLILVNYYMAPVWLTEGIIAYFEASEIDENGKIRVGPPPPRDMVTLIRDMVSKGKHIAPSKLIELQRYRFLTGENAAWSKERIYAWSMVFFMIHGPSKYRTVFDEWLSTCASKRVMPEDFITLVGDIKTFETAWEQYINTVKLPPPGIIKGNQFISEELGVILEKPPAWSFTPDGEGAGFQIGITSSKNRADLYVFGNSQKYSTESFARERARVLQETFNGVKESKGKLGEKDAVIFDYSDADRRAGKVPGGVECSYRHYIFAISEVVYEFILRIQLGKEDETKKDFEAITTNFKFTAIKGAQK
jgi:hypothetical protein